MGKVYCNNCKWFSSIYEDGHCCRIPTKKTITDFTYGGVYNTFIESWPSVSDYPNKDGNCKSYKRKWWKFWIKEK